MFDHAQNVFWVGYIAYQRGQLDGAATQFREYERLANRMVALAPDKKEYRLEQDYANTNLGTVLMAQHRYREAASTYGDTLGLAEGLAASEPANRDYQKQVNDALAWLADAQKSSGALEKSLATRERQGRLLTDMERVDARDTEVSNEIC